jgi:hypothetical protein
MYNPDERITASDALKYFNKDLLFNKLTFESLNN